VLLLYVVALAAGAVAYISYRHGLSQTAALIVLLSMALALFGVYLGRLEIYPENQVNLTESSRFFSLITDFSYKRQVATVLVDLVLIVVAYYSAYVLRFEGALAPELPRFVESLPVVIVGQLLAFAVFRCYQGMWRYTSVADFLRLLKAATVGTVGVVLALLFINRFEGYSRAVFVIDWVLLVGAASGMRLSFRALGELFHRESADGQRVLIYGAGDGGVMVLRELRNNRDLSRQPVGFLDDDRGKLRTRIQELPVLGGVDQLEEIVEATGATEVVVAATRLAADRLDLLMRRCRDLNVAVVRASLRLE
jgi:UDP-GlcNAc:undecaprenyl-phosphate GlcNAc-1-phosphate transferase